MTAPLVTLIILDGFGLAPAGPGNAVELAHTPHFDAAWNAHPHTTLTASGAAVGLPAGQMGNSEVGHLNLGAGRVVPQSLTYIDEQVASREYVRNEVLRQSLLAGDTWHIVGLVSDGGVHSSNNHLYALLDFAAEAGATRVRVHVITDGRDTAPDSGEAFITELEQHLAAQPYDAQVATVIGRYYAMDRDKRWDRTKLAWDALVHGKASAEAPSASAAIRAAYERGETDEFIVPTRITNVSHAQILNGDSVFMFNFRADRMRQLAEAFVQPATWDAFSRGAVPQVALTSMMEYQKDLPVPFAFAVPEITEPLAAVIAAAGYSQFHAAETEKYAHVTYFFNAQQEAVFPGEERLLVPSPKVATYDLQPEMSAPALAAGVAERIRTGADAFVLVNFANPDMVGHTGVIEAAVAACEATDAGLGEVLAATQERGGVALIVADHGNAEQLLAADGSPFTAHTTNPVPFIMVGGPDAVGLKSGGKLADVAPTVLALLGLPQPTVMTGTSLLEHE